MKKISALLVLVAIFAACTKKDDPAPTPTVKTISCYYSYDFSNLKPTKIDSVRITYLNKSTGLTVDTLITGSAGISWRSGAMNFKQGDDYSVYVKGYGTFPASTSNAINTPQLSRTDGVSLISDVLSAGGSVNTQLYSKSATGKIAAGNF